MSEEEIVNCNVIPAPDAGQEAIERGKDLEYLVDLFSKKKYNKDHLEYALSLFDEFVDNYKISKEDERSLRNHLLDISRGGTIPESTTETSTEAAIADIAIQPVDVEVPDAEQPASRDGELTDGEPVYESWSERKNKLTAVFNKTHENNPDEPDSENIFLANASLELYKFLKGSNLDKREDRQLIINQYIDYYKIVWKDKHIGESSSETAIALSEPEKEKIEVLSKRLLDLFEKFDNSNSEIDDEVKKEILRVYIGKDAAKESIVVEQVTDESRTERKIDDQAVDDVEPFVELPSEESFFKKAWRRIKSAGGEVSGASQKVHKKIQQIIANEIDLMKQTGDTGQELYADPAKEKIIKAVIAAAGALALTWVAHVIMQRGGGNINDVLPNDTTQHGGSTTSETGLDNQGFDTGTGGDYVPDSSSVNGVTPIETGGSQTGTGGDVIPTGTGSGTEGFPADGGLGGNVISGGDLFGGNEYITEHIESGSTIWDHAAEILEKLGLDHSNASIDEYTGKVLKYNGLTRADGPKVGGSVTDMIKFFKP